MLETDTSLFYQQTSEEYEQSIEMLKNVCTTHKDSYICVEPKGYVGYGKQLSDTSFFELSAIFSSILCDRTIAGRRLASDVCTCWHRSWNDSQLTLKLL